MEKLLSLVVPAFNEEEAMEQSFERTYRAMSSIGYPFEIIYIDDGSRDRTWEIISRLAREHEEVKALRFSRNFGHQLAVTAGMDEAKGDAVIIMDADLQDPPEVIADMVKAWEQGADIAYGKRLHRKGETAAKKFTAWCYYRLLNFMSAYPIPLDTGDFRLLDKAVADEFKVLREHNRFLRGMSAWLGYNAVPVEYVREERCAGKTKYTLKKMLRLAADGIFGFSSRPLTLIGWAGPFLSHTFERLSFAFLLLCKGASPLPRRKCAAYKPPARPLRTVSRHPAAPGRTPPKATRERLLRRHRLW